MLRLIRFGSNLISTSLKIRTLWPAWKQISCQPILNTDPNSSSSRKPIKLRYFLDFPSRGFVMRSNRRKKIICCYNNITISGLNTQTRFNSRKSKDFIIISKLEKFFESSMSRPKKPEMKSSKTALTIIDDVENLKICENIKSDLGKTIHDKIEFISIFRHLKNPSAQNVVLKIFPQTNQKPPDQSPRIFLFLFLSES